MGGGQPAVAQSAPMGAQQGGIIDWFRQRKQKRKLKKAGNFMDREQHDRNLMWFWNNSIRDDSATASKTASLYKYLNKTLGKDKFGNSLLNNTIHNSDKSSGISGLVGARLASSLAGALGGGRSKRQIGKLYKDLYAGQMAAAKSNGPLSDKKKADVDMRYGRGIESLKGVYLEQLRRMRDKYGTYGTQLHPDDFLSRAGVDYFDDHSLIQDVQQLMVDASDHLDYDNSADDRELRDLGNYYFNVFNIHNLYSTSDPLLMDEQNMDIHPDPEAMEFLLNNDNVMAAYDQEKLVHGPGMSKEEHQQYLEHLRKSYVQSGHQDRLFGRFL